MKRKVHPTLIFTSMFILFVSTYAGGLPKGFVFLDEIIPDISIELRYAGNNNFIGQRIDGYESGRCVITADAAYALKRAQNELRRFSIPEN